MLQGRPDGIRSTPLSCIPCGRGNSIVREFGEHPIENRAERLLRGLAFAIDAGRVRTSEGTVVYCTQSLTWPADFLKSKSGYVTDAKFSKLGRAVRLDLDGRVFDDFAMFVHIQNNRIYGGQSIAAPNAKMDDGYFDLFYVRKVGKSDFKAIIKGMQTGQHLSHPAVVHQRVQRVGIYNLALDQQPGLVAVDGELVGPDPVTLEVVPGATWLCV
eukprot:NODE_984_length_1776_cov_43.114650_g869_i0.p2 GENE.NODE_984_length_1776_cov_43.114650_g869_i0~~NODE_984_length_1776_cov_43.114650_g869_i0.p2  ORF type:complete len:214 (-),score=37.30 NODE_984_length_1776_cov_43.114650_g869_i0:196-837(-)